VIRQLPLLLPFFDHYVLHASPPPPSSFTATTTTPTTISQGNDINRGFNNDFRGKKHFLSMVE
jgi:hypothetical protein